MANKDERPGLLSKVALFVRNPTKDWSELDQLAQPQEPGYDKQALKAMIERKRQNDFVRKREFDQLRKLRNRDPGAMANMARPSFFQTSLPTDPDGRAITLKKIDEIEAQMSKQWWKGKQEAAQSSDSGTLAAGESVPPSSHLPGQSLSGASEPFEPTEAIALKGDGSSQSNEFAATQMASGAIPMGPSMGQAGSESNAVAAGFAAGDAGFSTSRLFAIESDEMATDPELEEAAIRFANGDDVGAEEGLLAALRGPQLQPEAAQSWAAALLDLYRATNRRSDFETAAREFALALDGAKPVWASLADWTGPVSAPAPQAPAGRAAAHTDADNLTWTSPATLNLPAMEDLRDAMSAHPMPWHINWSGLATIAPDAMPLLDGLFSSLCDEPVELQFSGGERVAQALRAIVPSGDRGVDTAWWQTRLNALRAMHMHDDFELAALDYCITYEVAPPAWADPRCHFTEVPAAGDAALTDAQNTVPASMDMLPSLQGDVLGDASPVLMAMDMLDSPSAKMVIDCGGLLRVDFAAAGSILNWVAMRQAQGKSVQFHGAHRLVAAFFNVIGINEHAKVTPRPM